MAGTPLPLLQPEMDQLSQNIPQPGDLGGFMFNGVYSLALKSIPGSNSGSLPGGWSSWATIPDLWGILN